MQFSRTIGYMTQFSHTDCNQFNNFPHSPMSPPPPEPKNWFAVLGDWIVDLQCHKYTMVDKWYICGDEK